MQGKVTIYCHVLAWFIDEVLDWVIRFITSYTSTQFGTVGNYSAIAILRTFQFTVAQALEFSVFTSRIQATEFSQSHCNFGSHMKSSCHSLIPSLPFLVNHLWLPSPELDPILFRLPACTPSTLPLLLLPCRTLLITTLHGPHGKHSLLLLKSVFTAPLPSNRRPIVPRVCFCGNVFTDPLPSNGYIQVTICCTHKFNKMIFTLQVW
jgi:hypothetical protein